MESVVKPTRIQFRDQIKFCLTDEINRFAFDFHTLGEDEIQNLRFYDIIESVMNRKKSNALFK